MCKRMMACYYTSTSASARHPVEGTRGVGIRIGGEATCGILGEEPGQTLPVIRAGVADPLETPVCDKPHDPLQLHGDKEKPVSCQTNRRDQQRVGHRPPVGTGRIDIWRCSCRRDTAEADGLLDNAQLPNPRGRFTFGMETPPFFTRRASEHNARLGYVYFDEHGIKLATVAVGSYRHLGASSRDLVKQLKTTVVGAGGGEYI